MENRKKKRKANQTWHENTVSSHIGLLYEEKRTRLNTEYDLTRPKKNKHKQLNLLKKFEKFNEEETQNNVTTELYGKFSQKQKKKKHKEHEIRVEEGIELQALNAYQLISKQKKSKLHRKLENHRLNKDIVVTTKDAQYDYETIKNENIIIFDEERKNKRLYQGQELLENIKTEFCSHNFTKKKKDRKKKHRQLDEIIVNDASLVPLEFNIVPSKKRKKHKEIGIKFEEGVGLDFNVSNQIIPSKKKKHKQIDQVEVKDEDVIYDLDDCQNYSKVKKSKKKVVDCENSENGKDEQIGHPGIEINGTTKTERASRFDEYVEKVKTKKHKHLQKIENADAIYEGPAVVNELDMEISQDCSKQKKDKKKKHKQLGEISTKNEIEPLGLLDFNIVPSKRKKKHKEFKIEEGVELNRDVSNEIIPKKKKKKQHKQLEQVEVKDEDFIYDYDGFQNDSKAKKHETKEDYDDESLETEMNETTNAEGSATMTKFKKKKRHKLSDDMKGGSPDSQPTGDKTKNNIIILENIQLGASENAGHQHTYEVKTEVKSKKKHRPKEQMFLENNIIIIENIQVGASENSEHQHTFEAKTEVKSKKKNRHKEQMVLEGERFIIASDENRENEVKEKSREKRIESAFYTLLNEESESKGPYKKNEAEINKTLEEYPKDEKSFEEHTPDLLVTNDWGESETDVKSSETAEDLKKEEFDTDIHSSIQSTPTTSENIERLPSPGYNFRSKRRTSTAASFSSGDNSLVACAESIASDDTYTFEVEEDLPQPQYRALVEVKRKATENKQDKMEKRTNKSSMVTGKQVDTELCASHQTLLKKMLSTESQKIELKARARTSKKRKKSILAQLNSGVINEISKDIKEQEKEDVAILNMEELVDDALSRTPNQHIDFEKLRNLEVSLPFSIPALHQIETRVTHNPTAEQKIRIEALDCPIKTGIFSKAEDDTIKRNFEEFCKVHDLHPDPAQFTTLIYEGKVTLPTEQRMKFVQFLAHGLPNRLLNTVYKRFKRMYNSSEIKNGRFTQRENKIILEFLKMTTSKTPYSDLAKILNRNNLALVRHAKHLINEDTKLKWDKANIDKFVLNLLKVTKCIDIDELKTVSVTPEQWLKLSKKMDGIPSRKLRRAWFCTIYSRIFVNGSVNLGEIRKELVQLLLERKETDWRNINWKEISEEFEAFTSESLSKLLRTTTSYHVPENIQSNLEDTLKYLRDEVFPKTSFRSNEIEQIHIETPAVSLL